MFAKFLTCGRNGVLAAVFSALRVILLYVGVVALLAGFACAQMAVMPHVARLVPEEKTSLFAVLWLTFSISALFVCAHPVAKAMTWLLDQLDNAQWRLTGT